MKRILGVVAMFTAISGFVGCAATSSVTTTNLEIPRTLNAPILKGEAAQFYDELVQPFLDRGFKVGKTSDPNAGSVIVEFEPSVWNTTFRLLFLHRGRLIASAEASNKGWGTGINRPNALKALVTDVQNGMTAELAKVSVAFLNDTTISASVCPDEVYADKNLETIADFVNLRNESLSTFKLLSQANKATDVQKEAIGVWAAIAQKCFNLVIGSLQQRTDSDLLIDQALVEFNELQQIQAALYRRDITFGEAAARQNQLITKRSAFSLNQDETARAQLADEQEKGKAATEATQKSWAKVATPPTRPIIINTQPYSVPRTVFTTCNRVFNQVNCTSY